MKYYLRGQNVKGRCICLHIAHAIHNLSIVQFKKEYPKKMQASINQQLNSICIEKVIIFMF